MRHNFLFFDFETFSLSTKEPVSQFAAIQTDFKFEISRVVDLYCTPPEDLVPNPVSCLITGISPLVAQRQGDVEYIFANDISNLMLKVPNNFIVGYNSLTFDDEINRNIMYRNFVDPYAWAWKNGNKRLDILPLVRLIAALSPESLKWKHRDETTLSYKLEDMCAANGITQVNAHNAVDDVLALKDLTKLISEQVPEIFSSYLNNSDARWVSKYIDKHEVFGLYHYTFRRTESVSYVTKLFGLGQKKLVVYNLLEDPSFLKDMTLEELVDYLKLKSKEKEEKNLPVNGFVRIKENGCPTIFSSSIRPKAIDEAINVDPSIIDRSLKFFKDNPSVVAMVHQAFSTLEEDRAPIPNDTDLNLYCSINGGFFSQEEKTIASKVERASSWEQRAALLAELPTESRAHSILLRIIGRAAPEALREPEKAIWESFVQDRLAGLTPHKSMSIEKFEEELRNPETLKAFPKDNPKYAQVYADLEVYLEKLKHRQ